MSRASVLIVEDDTAIAGDFAEMLERAGYKVTGVAATGEEALRSFVATRPEVVVLDVVLRGSASGLDVAAAITDVSPAAFVVVTGYPDSAVVEGATAIGSLGFVVKPVSERQLVAAIEVALYRFRAERELVFDRQRAQEEFRELFNAAQDAVAVTDGDGRLLLVNREFEERFGVRGDAVHGKWIEQFVLEPPVADGRPRGSWFFKLLRGHSEERPSLVARCDDGTEPPVELTLVPTGSSDDLRVIANIRDISERRLFQQAQSERRVLAEQFDRALRLETVGRLAGGVAHDFNNLLMVIEGHTDALLKGVDDRPTERRLLEGIRTTADRAAALTRQLLAFGRRQVLQPRAIDLSAAVSSTQSILKRVIRADIDIVTRVDDNLKPIKADPTQIEQVLLNLSLNARDAMPNGGTLTFDMSNFVVAEPTPLPSSSVAVIPPGEYVKLTVSDSGVGMSPETITRSFEPFFTTKEPGKGTGLGLSIVYGIVKQSAGFVWIDSQVGIGTSVHALLPIAVGAPAQVERPVRAVLPEPSGTGSVLLVEDEEDVRSLLKESLVAAGYRVTDAENGREAIDIFSARHVDLDLVITDVIMPETNGTTVVRTARRIKPDVKVLYMSGYTDDVIAAEIERDRLADYIQKPFSREVLLRKVADLLAVGAVPARVSA